MLVKVVRKTQLACSVWSGVRPAAISSPSFLISPALAKCKEKPVEGAGVTGTSRSLVLRWNSVSSMVARPLASVASKPASISRVRSGWMFASPATPPPIGTAMPAFPPITRPPCSDENFWPKSG